MPMSLSSVYWKKRTFSVWDSLHFVSILPTTSACRQDQPLERPWSYLPYFALELILLKFLVPRSGKKWINSK